MGHNAHDIIAQEIAEDLLYRTGLALTEGKFDGIADCFHLPQAMETREGMRYIHEPEDVVQIFTEVRRFFKETGIVDVVRTVVHSYFVSETEIESVHASGRMKANGELDRSPYPVMSVLKLCDDGKWRITKSCYGIVDSRAQNQALLAWKSHNT